MDVKINSLIENGLANADDFNAKLKSLKDAWENLVPVFHLRFAKHRTEQFQTCLVQSAGQQLGLLKTFLHIQA